MLHHALALPLALLLAGPGTAGPGASDLPVPAVTAALPPGTWSWPVHGPVLRGFDPPESPFGAGHRGIDIAVPIGTVVRAPEGAVVAFAGKVGGHLFVTLDHGGELTSTYSWLAAVQVRKGDVLARGQAFATSGPGHPGSVVPHLHLGVRLAGAYVDPLLYLEPVGVQDLIRLAPLIGSEVVAPAA
ncbi:MAG TPA: M23 family metallopeptidase [Actinomycetota bacterium]|nr:M23 family metallopeptidase [Actinomycetota bacterium]